MPRSRIGLIAGAVLVLLLGAAGVLTFHHRSDGGSATPEAATSAPTTALPQTESTAPTDSPSSQEPTSPPSEPATTAPASPANDATADISLVADHPRAQAVAATMTSYFTAINDHRYSDAYALYSAAWRKRNSLSGWDSGMGTSHDSEVQVLGITRGSGPAVQAEVQFISHQAAEFAPDKTSECTTWDLVYTLLPGGHGVPYAIDGAKSTDGVGYTPC